MAHYPTSLLALTFKLTTAYAIDVVDSASTRTIQVNSLGATRYFRFYACAEGDATASGATSETTAAEFANHLKRRLNNGISALWNVTVTNTGRVKITYSGTGTATIAFTGGSATAAYIREILGFTGNLTIASGSSVTATYQPMFCLFTIAATNATPLVTLPPNYASAKFGSKTYTIAEDTDYMQLSFNATLHPRTYSVQSAKSIYATPYEPNSASRFTANVAVTSLTAPYSFKDWKRNACQTSTGVHAEIGVFFVRFQLYVTSVETSNPSLCSTYDRYMLSQDTFGANGQEKFSQNSNDNLVDLGTIILDLQAKDVSL